MGFVQIQMRMRSVWRLRLRAGGNNERQRACHVPEVQRDRQHDLPKVQR